MSLFVYKFIEQGLEKFTINLKALYQDDDERKKFENRWKDFFISDKDNKNVFTKTDDTLTYLSESFIPTKIDNRPSLLLLFGNPATHSVISKSYFSYEGNNREHRIWRIFREVGLINFNNDVVTRDNLFEVNKLIKRKFFGLAYNSPFRIGMAVYYSMPSTASKPPWSGVAGVQKLLGKPAMQIIEEEEQKRIAKMVNDFLGVRGGIIAFQKDAYNGLRNQKSSVYNLNDSLSSGLVTKYKLDSRIPLVGVAPTRFLQGRKAKQTLKKSMTLLLNWIRV